MPASQPEFPRIVPLGVTGILVRFDDALTEPANRAALAYRAALDAESWRGVEESSTSLTSVYIAFDPRGTTRETVTNQAETLLRSRNWYDAPLPSGRRHWRIPVALGGAHGPQFDEVCEKTGLSPEALIADLENTQTRVLALGFAPSQPYLGTLPPAWDIPRQTGISPMVPGGALVTAVRQVIIFANDAPTGWRQIGQTRFDCFRPDSDDPFAFRPGDEVSFVSVSAEAFENLA